VKLFKATLVVCVLALCWQGARAWASARKPNLSGKWVMDAARSDFGDYDGPMSKAKTKLDIAHKDPKVRTVWGFENGVQSLAQLSEVFTDGRGETNASLLDADDILGEPEPVNGGGPGRQVKSKTTWEGTKLVTRTSDRLKLSGAFVEVEVLDEWELSADGKELTQTTRVTPARGDAGGARKFKRVYNRAE
jgi:hypothetical protein